MVKKSKRNQKTTPMRMPDTLPNLTQRTFLNAASNLLNYGAGVLVAFVLNPLLLTFLGPSLFGTWKICQRLLTYVSAADGRASQALKWTIANRRSITDDEQKQREIGCAAVVWLKFLPLMLLAGALISWFAPQFIKGLPSEHFTITRLACSVLVLNLLLLPLKSIPESVMIGMNMGYKTTWINAVGSLTSGVMLAFAGWIGWGLVGLACGMLLGSILRGVIILFQARRCLPWFALRRPDKAEVRLFFSFSIWILAWSLIQRLLLSSDIIILGLISGASLVASYTLTFYVVQSSVELAAILVSAGMPGMGDIIGRGQFERANQVRGEIVASSWLLAAVIGTMILLWNRPFISLWVGPDQFVGYGENLLMVVMMTQMIFIRMDAAIVDVTLKINTKVWFGALSTVVSLALAFLFGNVWDSPIAGILFGLIVGRLILSILYPILVGRALQGGSLRLFKNAPNVLRLSGVLGSLFFGAHLLAPLLKVENWIVLLLYFGFSLPIVFILALVFGCTGEQRRNIVFRLRQIFFRRVAV